MDVVVVESPAKAKTINKYLGDDYIVLASYGHVRDLPSKDGSVVPDDDFAMTYVTDDKSAKHVKAIADAMRGSDKLFLATDPDREGEAISWHVMKALADDYGMRDIPAKRVVFNEITKKAVVDGINNPRDLDMDLINAQQARRAHIGIGDLAPGGTEILEGNGAQGIYGFEADAFALGLVERGLAQNWNGCGRADASESLHGGEPQTLAAIG
jgi:5S rRNA maturation endonuclease (ribonuclease M5)